MVVAITTNQKKEDSNDGSFIDSSQSLCRAIQGTIPSANACEIATPPKASPSKINNCVKVGIDSTEARYSSRLFFSFSISVTSALRNQSIHFVIPATYNRRDIQILAKIGRA